MRTFGLTDRDVLAIQRIFGKYLTVKEIRIFGSRSKGTHYAGSDIDLAIMDEGINLEELLRIRSDFEESDLPYKVDVICYPDLIHQELKYHIERTGKVFITANSAKD